MPEPSKVAVYRLVLVPAAITLAVTVLRVTGELLRWSPSLFNREAGGGGRPDMAMAGGSDPSKLPGALASVRSWAEQRL